MAEVYRWFCHRLGPETSLSQTDFARLMALAANAPLTVLDWIETDKVSAIDALCQAVADWLEGRLDHHAVAELLEEPFAVQVLYQQLTAHLREILVGAAAKGGADGTKFVPLQQLINELTRFGGDSRAVLGQNKALARLKLLARIQHALKEMTINS